MPDGTSVDRTGPQQPTPDPRLKAETAATRRRSRGRLRLILFALLPMALLGALYVYATGGQVMETDNAYVQANTVGVTSEVAGTVAAIEVHDNEQVHKGQVLFRLEEAPFRIALDGAEAQLGAVRNQVLTLQATYRQSQAEIAQAEADLPYYEATFRRQQDLSRSAAASAAAFDKAKQDLTSARQKVEVAKAQAVSVLAQLGGDADLPIEQNPSYLQARSAVDKARRDLDDCGVRAPFDGIVTNVPALQVGAYLNAAQQAFSLVSNSDVWIAANPKETELTFVEPGQRVKVSVDTYPGVEWEGVVGSISPASASSFSLLPAQNSSGNWVKVVQRIPMIVRLRSIEDRPPLRVGMSVTVAVDTGHVRGLPVFIADLLDKLGVRHG
jgi:membrane fusion protein, multidrug efflux system